jgi:hypothetical protein
MHYDNDRDVIGAGPRMEDLRDAAHLCDERRCGDSLGGGDEEDICDDPGVTVKMSGIRNAGWGLFTNRDIGNGSVIGYMDGTLRCCVCVKRDRLTRGKHRYSAIQCGILENDEEEEVLWYITRTGGGKLWYINSSRSKCKKKQYRTPNSQFIFEGFDINEKPVLCVRAIEDIESGVELLVDYMDVVRA